MTSRCRGAEPLRCETLKYLRSNPQFFNVKKRRKLKKSRNRRRGKSGRRLKWQQILIMAASALVIGALGFGYYIIDLFAHSSLWNTLLAIAMVAFVVMIISTNARWRRP